MITLNWTVITAIIIHRQRNGSNKQNVKYRLDVDKRKTQTNHTIKLYNIKFYRLFTTGLEKPRFLKKFRF